MPKKGGRGPAGAKPPEKRPPGRPSATPEAIDARWAILTPILARLSVGETLRAVCREERQKQEDAGLTPTFPAEGTVRMWVVADEPAGIAAQYARAREGQAEAWADQIIEISDDGSRDTITKRSKSGEEYEAPDYEWMNRSKLRVDSRKWLMAKLHPAKYGEKMDVTSGGKPLEPQTIMIAGKEITF